MRGTTRAALILLVSAMSAAAAAQTAAPRRSVVIGCVSRANANAPYTLTDSRRDPPAVYRLNGDPKELSFLVGQTVEIAGPITPGGAAEPPQMKVESVARIATTCAKAR